MAATLGNTTLYFIHLSVCMITWQFDDVHLISFLLVRATTSPPVISGIQIHTVDTIACHCLLTTEQQLCYSERLKTAHARAYQRKTMFLSVRHIPQTRLFV